MTRSPGPTQAISIMFMAVPAEHGSVASLASSMVMSGTRWALAAGTAQNWAKPPSRWAPRKCGAVPAGSPFATQYGSHTTRWPSIDGSTSSPAATMWPDTSAPWMRGNPMSLPHPLSSDLSYQPMRVLMSVLLMPAARTLITTSCAPGRGTGMSSRNSRRSKPPWPVSTTPDMLVGSAPSSGMSGGAAVVLDQQQRRIVVQSRVHVLEDLGGEPPSRLCDWQLFERGANQEVGEAFASEERSIRRPRFGDPVG